MGHCKIVPQEEIMWIGDMKSLIDNVLCDARLEYKRQVRGVWYGEASLKWWSSRRKHTVHIRSRALLV